MRDHIRFGIVGGLRGMSYYKPLTADPRAEVTAVCESDPEKHAGLREQLPAGTGIFTDPQAMFESGKIDAVILANYFHEHGRLAIAAMNAGLDVASETTAAPTLGECLDLVETAERTGRKYILAANCPVMPGAAELKRIYESGELGPVFYAEAEYLHGTVSDEWNLDGVKGYAPGSRHWRRYLPGLAYNMHSLGVLMEITGKMPRRVMGMDIDVGDMPGNAYKQNRAVGGVGLYEMEGGSVFRSTGCCSFGPDGKWYRLSCRWGTAETVLGNQDRVLYRKTGEEPKEYDPETRYAEEEKSSGHGGADGRICKKILGCFLDDEEVFFDVYRSAALSAAGICGHYSVIDGKSYDIPDFRDKEAREAVRGDYRTPFPDRDGIATLPCNARLAKEAGFRIDADDGSMTFRAKGE